MKALLDGTEETNESKEFDTVNKAIRQSHKTQNVKRIKGMSQTQVQILWQPS